MTNTETSQNKYMLIAKRYAESLIELANDGKMSNELILSNLYAVNDVLQNSEELEEILENPTISEQIKKDIIAEVFANENIDDLIKNFLKILVERGRFSAFSNILEAYKSELDKINNLSRVSVTSAIELDEAMKSRIKQKIEEKLKKTVIPEWKINSEIIAGLVVKIGDTVIDNSLRNKLNNLSKNITK